MELIIIRHGKAVDALKWSGNDEERPLIKKGEKRITRLGKYLQKKIIGSVTVWVSPLKRAQQTWKILSQDCVNVDEVENKSELRLEGDLEILINEIDQFRNSNPELILILIGHNPNLSELSSRLDSKYHIILRTGEAVWLELNEKEVKLKEYISKDVISRNF